MKVLLPFILVGAISLSSCKSDKKTETKEPVKELSVLEKIAFANGFENWKNVNELQFTFNVDRDTSHFQRTWIWKPKTNDVTAISLTDTIIYNRKQMDSVAQKTDGGFINDKYWLLAPINIMWDEPNLTQEVTENAEAPISKTPMQKLTVVYGNAGGYTPGDAYDFYFGDDYIVKEWVFRRGNQAEPSMATTWEDYKNESGLNIAMVHNNAEGNFKLYFTDVVVGAN